MPDFSKINLQKIIGELKAFINAKPLPEGGKDDPVGYYLGEAGKMIQVLAETQNQQIVLTTKLMETMGNLINALKASRTEDPERVSCETQMVNSSKKNTLDKEEKVDKENKT